MAEEKNIEIPYCPRIIFDKYLHESDKRWNVFIGHRRIGKTVATINHLIRDAIQTPKSRFAYIAPTYKQAKGIAWDYLKHYSQPIPYIKINESELRIDYPNKSRITLYGADNPDSLRGLKLWGVVFDEYSQQPSNIFSEIIRPALADTKGYAVWIGTPKGKNEFHRLYEENKHKDNWNCVLKTIEDSVDEDPLNFTDLHNEAIDAKSSMTVDEWDQEWMCSFEASIKGAYYAQELAKSREDGRITSVPHDTYLDVFTVWDLGISDYTTIGFFQVYGKEVRLIDYYENHGQGLEHYVDVLRDKEKTTKDGVETVGYRYKAHYFPHDIQVRELGTGKSRKETLENMGIRVEVVKNLSVEDGISAGRMLFNKLWIDAKNCELFVDAISQYRQEWDDKKGCFRNKPLHDWTSHAADMYRYAAISVEKMLNPIRQVKQYKVDWSNKLK